jgi:hypothetical protein
MSNDVLTIAALRQALEVMKQADSRILTVKTPEEAMRMTRDDPFGAVWAVGDEYILLVADPQQSVRVP